MSKSYLTREIAMMILGNAILDRNRGVSGGIGVRRVIESEVICEGYNLEVLSKKYDLVSTLGIIKIELIEMPLVRLANKVDHLHVEIDNDFELGKEIRRVLRDED